MAPKTVNRKGGQAVGRAPLTAGNRDGSVIVGVLIAVTFIGIVTSAMIMSTGSQARVSTSFTTVMNAALSASNGVVATESYFSRPENEDSVLSMIGALAGDASGNEFRGIYGEGKRQRISDDQYFRSRLVKVDEIGGTFFAQFEVEGSAGERGKATKGVRAYYEIGNVKYENVAEFGGRDAFLLNGNMKGNDGMRVNGYATFAGTEFIFNSNAKAEFNTENGVGDVYFNGVAVFNTPPVFHTKAYFHSNVDIKASGVANAFHQDVGFQANFDAGNGTVNFGGDVFMNGAFRIFNSPGNNSNGKMGGVGKFYHTDMFNMYAQAPWLPAGPNNPLVRMNILPVSQSCTHFMNNGFPPPAGVVCEHGLGASAMFHNSGSIHQNINFSLDKRQLVTPAGGIDILERLQMDDLATRKRREPDLDLGIGRMKEDFGKEFVQISNVNVTAAYLDDLVKQYEGQSQYFHNGHLLLQIPQGSNVNVPQGSGTFNGKVIFRVDGDMNSNCGLYNSGPDASTLVYVSKTGKVNDLGTDGAFRGLIYVDPENNNASTFRWGPNSTIDGAVLLKGGKDLYWNSSASPGVGGVTITRNDEILRAFGSLVPVDPDAPTVSGSNVVKIDNDMPIDLIPIGIYYY